MAVSMMQKKLGTLALIAVVVSACAATKFLFQGKEYGSAELALSAQRTYNDSLVSGISPTTTPRGRRALVVLPSRHLIQERIVRHGPVTPEAIDYVVASSELGYQALADCLISRKIFDSVDVARSDIPEQVTSGKHDVTVFPLLPAPGQEQWFFRDSSHSEPVPIFVNQALSPGRDRTLSWLDSVENAAGQREKQP